MTYAVGGVVVAVVEYRHRHAIGNLCVGGLPQRRTTGTQRGVVQVSPQIVELGWKSGPHQSEIRQKHLRKTDPATLATDLVVSTISERHSVLDVEKLRESRRIAQKFVERQRLPRERRVMTAKFLQSVAQVYRENIDGAPTKAVGKAFNVKDRMASKYVDMARQKGYLSPTSRGKKKAY